ncbi:PepSY-associated TM helix domain-containing protein [Paenibacillus solisilvae]|uniref:PepSY-associated TM helix domain-containing protein n=1 Tax=Paenibacillus solisilvae TaxID=2486751 RepID=A0ABW0W3K8_9BACL
MYNWQYPHDRTEVESWLYPIDKEPTTDDVGVAAIQQHADAWNPELKTEQIELPKKDGFYHVHVSKDGKDAQVIYADPGTGEVFGKIEEERREPFETIYNLHRYFLLTSVIGKKQAASFVGWMGVGMVLILLTGVYLWWPGIKKLALGFRIVRNRGKLIHNMGLHKTIGIISIPLLLLAALTGVVNAFEKSIPGWAGFKAKEEVPASAKQYETTDKTILPVDRVLGSIEQSYPNSKLVNILFPQKPGESYQIGLKEGFGASDKSNSTVYMKSSTGQVLYKTDPNLTINLYNAWRKGLHFATWGGTAMRLISFVFGIMPLVLMITGIVIWQLKARARKRNKKKDKTTVAAA